MTHSILIVGGTKKKRSRASEEKSLALKTPSERGSGKSLAERSLKFDTTILEPEEDKQSISMDQIRDLQHQLSLKPYAADHKIGILPEAQRMTVEAQNALLKTLEEPPAHSVLILTAPSTKQLLPTIVSRCQIVRLEAEVDLNFESEEHQKSAEEFLTLLQSNKGKRLEWAEKNKKTINYQLPTIHLLDIWISVLRDLLLTHSNPSSSSTSSNSKNLILNQKLQDKLSFILSSMKESNNSVKSIALCSSILLTQKTQNLIASINVSPRLALEVLLLDLPIL